jgi:hypothetical protein
MCMGREECKNLLIYSMIYRKPKEKIIPKELYKGFYIVPCDDGSRAVTVSDPFGCFHGRYNSKNAAQHAINEKLRGVK